MNNQDAILRKVGCGYMDGKKEFTQLEISKELGVSLSIVNRVVTTLREINAVRVRRRSFSVIALDRLLLYWATHRNLKKDIVYQTRADLPVEEIERTMPNGIAFTAYTAYRLLFGEAPADYSEVYLYADGDLLKEVKRRFGSNDRIPNVIVLKCDRYLEVEMKEHKLRSSSVCRAQLFVDLWNINQWYAKDYVDALSKRLGI